MMRSIALFALFLACVQARNVTFENCSKNGMIYNTDVVPCPSEPCTFNPGDKVKLSGNFETSIASSKPTLRTEIKVNGSWIQYSAINTDACVYTACPIQANVIQPFSIETEVIDWPESFATEMKFQLFNEDKVDLICGINVVVINAKK